MKILNYFSVFLFALSISLTAQTKEGVVKIQNSLGDSTTKSILMDGNNIVVLIRNDGSISPGLGLIRNINNFVWNGLGDFYTSGIVVGGEVKSTSNTTIHILSDAVNDIDARDLDPSGTGKIWGWNALHGFDNPDGNSVATNDDPASWPPEWTAWNGLYGKGKVLAAKETYFVMDDRNNTEFNYFPFPDSTRKGLGIEVSGRLFQFDDVNGADVLFAHYTIKNVSTKKLEKVTAGFYLDVDVGGGVGNNLGGVENTDDLAFFNQNLNLVYYWDENGKGYMNRPTHYTGVVQLTTPGNSSDTKDNDGDGLIDESQSNGIDDDGDWDPAIHDTGKDGVPGTNDSGENDGIPTAGEQNFEILDTEESDEIGLSSFRSWALGQFRLRDDEIAWNVLHNGFNDTIPPSTDIVSLFGTGDFPLDTGKATTYALAFFCTWSLDSTIALAKKITDEYVIRFSPGGEGNKSIAVKLTSPTIGQSVFNGASITWQSTGILNNRTVDLWFSNVVENDWHLLQSDITDAGSYSWNTLAFRDGAFYKIRLISKKYGNKGYAESEFFRVDNPGNSKPEGYFTSVFKKPFKDTIAVSWVSGDAEGSTVYSVLFISTDNGGAYSFIDSVNSINDYALDTKKYPNSYQCTFKLVNSDGVNSSETISPNFTIANVYKAIKDSAIVRTGAVGTGEIIPVVIDSALLNGHQYEVRFDSLNNSLIYSILDKTSNVVRIDKEPLPSILASGRYFDGIRMTIRNDRVGIDSGRSGFNNTSTAGLLYTLSVPWVIGSFRPAPLDVRIEFTSLDTTSEGKYVLPGDTLYALSPFTRSVLTPFKISFLNSQLSLEAMVLDATGSAKNNRWDLNDRIEVLTPPPYRISSNNIMMQLIFFKKTGTMPGIKNGDVFIARSTKPFTSTDKAEFTASANLLGPTGVTASQMIPSEYSLSQNFPNPFNPSTTIRFELVQTGKVSVKVYDALGREIKTLIDDERSAGRYETVWAGHDNNSMPVASGLYYYRMISGKFMQTKKMVLLK